MSLLPHHTTAPAVNDTSPQFNILELSNVRLCPIRPAISYSPILMASAQGSL